MATKWYAYDRSGTHSPPYFDSRAAAAEACDEDEQPRPVDESVLDLDVDSDADPDPNLDVALDELSHDDLKDLAETEGIAAETDLRSKAAIIDALRDGDA